MPKQTPNTSKFNSNHVGFDWIECIFCIILIFPILHPLAIQSLNQWSDHFIQRDFFNKYSPQMAAQKLENLRVTKGYFDSNRIFDISDRQYRIFRKFAFRQIGPLSLFIIIGSIIRYILKKYYKKHIKSDESNHHLLTGKLSKYLILFYVFINICVTLYMHGTISFFILSIMCINYLFCKASYKHKYGNICCWIMNIFIVCLIIKMDAKFWSFEYLIHPNLAWMDALIRQRMRFSQSYRFILLRCISFNMDLRSNYLNQRIYASKFETNAKHNLNDYTLLNYFGFTLYLPLMFTGPIMSFHEWIQQIKANISQTNPYSDNELSAKSIFVYFVRIFIVFMLVEAMLHFVYIPMMTQHNPFPLYLDECRTEYDYAKQLLLLSVWCYFCVFFLWAKFLLIWRYQRLWALMDGIVPTENMQRCVFHNVSIVGFWKHWHSSFNVWNLRYIFIPMGGSKKSKFLNILIVFAFTTLWHGDFEFKLLIWGSLMSLLIVPELLMKKVYFYSSNEWIVRCRNNERMNRYVHAFGAVFNILMLFVANLIGFGPGYKVVMDLFWIIVSKWICLLTFVVIYAIIFCGALLMFHADYWQAKWKSNQQQKDSKSS